MITAFVCPASNSGGKSHKWRPEILLENRAGNNDDTIFDDSQINLCLTDMLFSWCL